MSGQRYKAMRRIVGTQCTHMPYDTDNYRLREVSSIAHGRVYVLELAKDSPRYLYKQIKKRSI
jgi:hypothetical protein